MTTDDFSHAQAKGFPQPNPALKPLEGWVSDWEMVEIHECVVYPEQ